MTTQVFLFAGQSNAQGYGNRTQLDPVPTWAQNAANGWTGAPTVSSDTTVRYPHPTAANSPSLYVENNTGLLSGVTDGWGPYDGCNPAFGNHAGEQGSYGPELAFLQRYRADHPGTPIAAIKCVLGGSSLADWHPTTPGPMWTVFATMIDQAAARLAGASFAWAGLIWMQGESGASTVWPYLFPTPGAEYKDDLRRFLAAVRAKTSPALRVVIGRIGNQMLADNIILPMATGGLNTAENLRGATNDRRAQQVEVGGDPGNVWADTDNLPVLQTGDPAFWYHATSAGYLAMGERFYAAFQSAAPPPPPPPPLTVSVTIDGVAHPERTARVTLNGTPIGASGDVLAVDVVLA